MFFFGVSWMVNGRKPNFSKILYKSFYFYFVVIDIVIFLAIKRSEQNWYKLLLLSGHFPIFLCYHGIHFQHGFNIGKRGGRNGKPIISTYFVNGVVANQHLNKKLGKYFCSPNSFIQTAVLGKLTMMLRFFVLFLKRLSKSLNYYCRVFITVSNWLHVFL